nr:hypothetical protein [Tanacetum cinerariifolium]
MKIQENIYGTIEKQVRKLNQEVFRASKIIKIDVKIQEFKSFTRKFSINIIKIQVAQKKVKIAFENPDSSSRVELIPSKIKYANKVILNFHKESSVFSSFKGKGNDRLLLDQVFKNKEEVVIKKFLRSIVPK